MAAQQSKDSQRKPLFTARFVLFLVVVATLSGWVTAKILKKQTVKPNPHAKNPNVIPLRPVPKDKWRPMKADPQRKYIERNVFPYINKNQKPLLQCYFTYRGKPALPKRGGKVTFEFLISQNGDVSKLKVFEGPLDKASILKIDRYPTIKKCLMGHIQTWKFPPHNFSKPLRHYAPFFFRR